MSSTAIAISTAQSSAAMAMAAEAERKACEVMINTFDPKGASVKALQLYSECGECTQMKTVIFDLDGTLADINHRLPFVQNGRKEWDAFYAACPSDGPKHDIIELARMCEDAGHDIIISSGRSENVRQQTVEWLKLHKVPFDHLLMRPNACFVPDQALKKAWLDDGQFGPKENILFVVEDRDRMVQMWRQQGLTVLQCEQWVEEGEVSFSLKKIELARNMAKYISATGQDARFNQWVQGQVK